MKGELSHSQPQVPLRFVLTLPFVLQTVAAVALVGYLSFRSGQRAVTDLAEQLMVESGDRVVQKLEDYLAVPQYVTQTTVYSLQAGLLDGFDLGTLEPHLAQQLKILPNLSAVAIANEDREFLVIERLQPQQLVIRKLDAASQDRAFYRYLADANGQNPVLQGIRHNYDPHNDPPGDPWYREARNHPQGIWRLAVSLSRGESSPYLQLARFLPFYNAQGKFQGVVASGVSLEQLGAFLQNLNAGHHGQVFLMEQDGMLVATSTGEVPFDSQPSPDHAQNVAVRPRRLAASQSQDPLTRAIAQQFAKTGSLTRLTQPQSSVVHFNHERYFVRVTPLAGELDWFSVIVVPESDFMAAIHANVYRTAFLCGLALLGSVGLGLWVARRVSMPILKLHDVVQNFSVGQAVTPLVASRIQEVDALRMAFNQMMTQLNSSFRAMQEHQQTLETFLDSVPVGVSVHSPSGQIVFMNKKGKEILQQEVLKAEIGDLAAAYRLYIAGTNQLYPTEHLPVMRTLRGEATYIDDIEIEIEIDGRRIPTEVYTIPVFDKEGNVIYAINAFQDTTERRQAEQLRVSYNRDLERQVAEQTQALRDSKAQLQQFTDAIQRSETQLRLLTDSLPVFIAYVDLEERYRFVNLAYEKQFGLSRQEILGRHTRDIVGEASYALNQPYIKRVLAGESPHYDITLPTATGEERHLSVILVPDLDDQAQVRGFYSLVIDISDRKQAEEQLRIESDFRRTIESAIVEGIAMADLEGRQSYVNPAFCRMVGWSEEELLGAMPPYVYWPPEEVDNITQAFQRCLDGDRPPQGLELRFVRRNGERFDVLLLDAPLRNSQGEITAWLASVYDITQRKQSELALKHTLLELNYHIEHSPLATIRWGQDFRVEHWSKQAEEIFGWRAEEVMGKTMYDWPLIVEQDLEHVNQFATQLLAGQSCLCYNRNYRKDGSIVHCEWYNSALVDENGKLISILSLVQDISDRKVAEQALQRYERIVSATTDAVSLVDRNYHYQMVNQTYLDWNNKTYPEIVGHSVAELIGQDVFEDVVKPLLDQCLAGETVQYSEWFDFSNMGRQFVSVTYSPFLEADQTISGIVVSVRNITPLKEAEEALRSSEERFRSAFCDAPIGMALIGLDYHWLKVNPMLCEMFGYAEGELLSIDLETLVHPEDKAVLQTYYEKLRMGERSAKHEKLRYVRSDGNISWGLISISLVRSVEDKPSYYVAQIQDITEQYAIDRMKNEFISIVSHELRTPLTAIRGFLGLLDTGIYDNQPDKAKRMLHQAVSNTDRLVRLVNDILDLERLSSGKVPLMMAVCDVGSLMRRAVAELQPIADKANITIMIDAISAKVWAFEDGIIQTLTNLLSNAIKFSPAGSQVILSAEIQTETVLFSVKDQGRGIPSENLETIFGRFQQVDVSDSRQKGGTGLGLAICQSIIQQHGGNIWAESVLGEGSTFYFTLKLCVE